MKTMRKGFYLVGAWMLTMMFVAVSCDSEDDVYESGEGYSTAYKDGSEGSSGSGENGSDNQEGNTDAGIVTAGEWCDLTHWDFWSRLMLGNDFGVPEDEKSEILWDAENYGQINPQITNEQGIFAWDVPQGQWVVKLTKDGYEILTHYPTDLESLIVKDARILDQAKGAVIRKVINVD